MLQGRQNGREDGKTEVFDRADTARPDALEGPRPLGYAALVKPTGRQAEETYCCDPHPRSASHFATLASASATLPAISDL